MADAINPTYDLAHEDVNLARRRAMAEAMMKQAMEPLQQQTAGGYVVPITGMQGLAKVAQALLARNDLRNVDERTKEADANFSGRLGQVSEAYARMRESDPMGAFKAAMSSGIKPLMQLAMQDMKASQMKPNEEAELHGKFTPESIQAWKQNKQQPLVPLPKVMEVNGQVASVNQVTGAVQGQPANMRTKWGPVQSGPGGIPMQIADTGEGKSFTGGNVTPERTGLNALETGAGGAVIKNLEGSHERMKEALNTFQRIATMEGALNQGAKTGPLANTALYTSKLLNNLGIQVDPNTPTEVLRMQLGEGVLENARKLAPVTEQDVNMLEDIKGGLITGEAALRASIDLLQRQSVKAIEEHEKNLRAIPKEAGTAMQTLAAQLAVPAFSITSQGIAPKANTETTFNSGGIKFLGVRNASGR